MTLAVAILVSGCAPSQPVITPVPAASSTPVFASDDDALKAAEVAYRAYLAASDLVTQSSGINPERVRSLVTAAQYDVELQGFAYFKSNGLKTTGSSNFRILALQQYRDDGRGSSEVALYVCSDSAQVRVVNAAGLDVTPISKPAEQTLEVVFINSASGKANLLLESTGIWPSAPEC